MPQTPWKNADRLQQLQPSQQLPEQNTQERSKRQANLCLCSHRRGGLGRSVRTAVRCRGGRQAERQPLRAERHVLRDRGVVALAVRDVQVAQIVWVEKEHVHVLV